jgi:N5-(cytidine 5'-diphosphoramidyl)-L-glutamine hydrolase
MSARKRSVLVTQRLVGSEGIDEVRECLDRRWGHFFAALDLLPIPLASGASALDYIEALAPVGVVLTGGNDLASVTDDALSADRDAFERQLVTLAEARGLPVLGVCRGMQLLAERAGFVIEPCTGHVATLHALAPSGTSRYPALQEPRTANSFHRFAARSRPGSGFEVVLRSADGVAEAIEHQSRPTVGIMWHPERGAVPRSLDLDLFRQVLLS